LTALLAKKARFLEPSVAADMLTFFVHFGLTNSDLALNVYLHVVMKQINNLALDELATLTYNLDQLGSTAQSEHFMKALILLCNTRRHQLGSLSVENVIFLLNSFGADLEYVNELLRALWRDRFDIVRPHTAVAVMHAISQIFAYPHDATRKSIKRHRKLESWCISTILQQIDKIEIKDAISLLVSCRHLRLYNSELLNAIGKQFSGDDVNSLTDRILLWSSLVELGYLHSMLSDGILRSVDDSTVQSLSTVDSVFLLRLMAERVYYSTGTAGKNDFQWIESAQDAFFKFFDNNIVKFCADCCALAPGMCYT